MRKTRLIAALTLVTLSTVVSYSAMAAKKGDSRGEALKSKKTLRFDGRSVEAVNGGKFNSFTHMNEGDGGRGQKKLYELPRNFSTRIADEADEVRYRK